jgi:hypothetical protein
MKQILFLLVFMVFLSSKGQCTGMKAEVKNPEALKQISNTYTFKVLPLNNGTWCYDIYKNKKILIHQTNIPGLPGNDGFRSKSGAEKVARLVIKKLKNGEMPPTITTDEMNKLKVL